METDNYSQVAEIQLTYKSNLSNFNRPRITSSYATHKVLKSIWNSDTIELREEFKILLLNRANQVLGFVNIGSGSICGVVVETKHIVTSICKANASGVILAHNHPSGSTTPSSADKKLTQKILNICKLIEVKLFDHIILTEQDEYFSFADEGLL